jgi:hypothetical protein
MFRTQSLLIVAMLMTSATAFAADTPDASSKGEAVLPSGSVEGVPSSTPPPAAKLPPGTGQSGANPDAATAPGEENQGKPPVAPE